MRIRYGGLWDNHPNELVVVPVNIGFKRDGMAVMGAGVAKQAADRYPQLVGNWGWMCQRLREETPVILYPQFRVIMFPTKPLDEDCPSLSWKQDADLKLIWRSAAQLAAFCWDESTISLPLVGCGHGRLTSDLVLPVLKTFLNHNRFQLVAEERNRIEIDGIIHGKWSNWLLLEDPRPKPDGQPLGTHFLHEVGALK